jgi:TRAP-type mannitol/chloroaromatic compound transport system substrate-binding protein
LKKKALRIVSLVVVTVMVMFIMVGCAKQQSTPTGDSSTTEAPAKVYNLRMQSFLGPGWKEWEEMLPNYVKLVEQMSGGRIKIELYPPGGLVPVFESLTAVGEGVVDMAYTAMIYWKGMFPSAELAWGVPFSLRTVDEYDHMWWELGLIDAMREEYAKYNVFLLAPIWSDEWGATISTKPIRSLEDFKGKKIRTFGIWGEIMNEFGASVVSMPGDDIYTGMALGTIDGANWGSPYGFYVSKHHEVAKYYTGPSVINFDIEDIFINMDTFKSMPADLQEILITATRLFAYARASRSTWESTQAINKMEAAGVKFITLPEEDIELMKQKSMELFEKRAQIPENKKVAEIIRKAMEAYNNRWEKDPRIRH